MCDCVPDSQRERVSLDPAWLASGGRVIHPDAPRGGGGAGYFRTPGATKTEGGSDELPHPDTAAALALEPVQLQQAQQLQQAPAKRQPAPRIKTSSTETINGMEVTVLPDEDGIEGIKGAFTDMTESGGGSSFTMAENKISWTVLPYTVAIVTQYGTGDPEGDAAYGRGTTDDDKNKGNVTLGFHESCHRQDLLDYLRNNTLPAHTGTEKMTLAQANAAVAAYVVATKAYFKNGRAASVLATDETADAKPKKSEHDKKK